MNHPELIVIEPSFEENNIFVSIHLKWTLNKEDSSYSVSFTVTPHVHAIMIVNNQSATMKISYNTFYNVNIIGTVDVCGYSGVLSSTVSLFYGEDNTSCVNVSMVQTQY